MTGSDYNPSKGRSTAYALGYEKLPWIMQKTANGCIEPWNPSQSDLLAEDWVVIQWTQPPTKS